MTYKRKVIVLNLKNKSQKEIENIISSFVNRGRLKPYIALPFIKLKGKNNMVSIQASHINYCTPRKDKGPYTKVELGFPNFLFSTQFIERYAEQREKPKHTVYGWVPISEIAAELKSLY